MAPLAPTPLVPPARQTHLVIPSLGVRLLPPPSSLPPAEPPALIQPTRSGRTTPATVMDGHASLTSRSSRFGLAHLVLQRPLRLYLDSPFLAFLFAKKDFRSRILFLGGAITHRIRVCRGRFLRFLRTWLPQGESAALGILKISLSSW
ncbi:hypothetical protein NL676_035379 [Syzygium grande]|nr:hypothetical protein NL676_035379 [Syzygium grande]